jgi:hypothetical protein
MTTIHDFFHFSMFQVHSESPSVFWTRHFFEKMSKPVFPRESLGTPEHRKNHRREASWCSHPEGVRNIIVSWTWCRTPPSGGSTVIDLWSWCFAPLRGAKQSSTRSVVTVAEHVAKLVAKQQEAQGMLRTTLRSNVVRNRRHEVPTADRQEALRADRRPTITMQSIDDCFAPRRGAKQSKNSKNSKKSKKSKFYFFWFFLMFKNH